MTFWMLALAMLVAAVLCVLLPLSRRKVVTQTNPRAEFYEAQLRELGFDGEESPNDESAQERAEIGRRLIEARQQQDHESDNRGGHRTALITVSLGALVFIPGFTAVMYGMLGAPGFETGQSAVENIPLEERSVEQLIYTAERQLEKNPEDLRGWTVVAAVYGRSGQFDKRANALSQIIRISGPSGQLLADLGEARSLANGGVVAEQAVRTLRQALDLEPKNIKARAYLLLASEQEGKFDQALDGWRELLTAAKGQVAWEERIREHVAALQNRSATLSQAGPNRDQLEGTAKLAPAERQAMVESMVSGLAQRLEDQPDDIDGWLRLLRSYHVLRREDAFQTAWSESTAFFVTRPEETARLMAAAEELGYSVSEDGALTKGVSQ